VCQLSIYNSFPVIRTTIAKKSSFLRTPAFIFCLPLGRPCGNYAKRCMNEKTIQCLPNPFAACTHLSWTVSQLFEPQVQKITVLTTAVQLFVSPGDAFAIITQYVAWMERQFDACQTPRSMYLSIFNSFRVIRCLSQCVSPKIAILPHLCFPWECSWGNHAKCCTDGKRIRCLQIVSLRVFV